MCVCVCRKIGVDIQMQIDVSREFPTGFFTVTVWCRGLHRSSVQMGIMCMQFFFSAADQLIFSSSGRKLLTRLCRFQANTCHSHALQALPALRPVTSHHPSSGELSPAFSLPHTFYLKKFKFIEKPKEQYSEYTSCSGIFQSELHTNGTPSLSTSASISQEQKILLHDHCVTATLRRAETHAVVLPKTQFTFRFARSSQCQPLFPSPSPLSSRRLSIVFCCHDALVSFSAPFFFFPFPHSPFFFFMALTILKSSGQFFNLTYS